MNERIRAREVRVVDETGKNLGTMHPRDATRIAKEKKLDLVEVSPNAEPPVCKILDYGKWRYERDKQKKESKPAKSVSLREVKMRPKIGEHDFQEAALLEELVDEVGVLARQRHRGGRTPRKRPEQNLRDLWPAGSPDGFPPGLRGTRPKSCRF